METIRTYLQEELVRRCKTNPRYSLRSFAKYLQMNPSLLSKILRGHVGVSPKRFEQICERMSIGPGERAQLAMGEDRHRTVKKQDLLFRELKHAATRIQDQVVDMVEQFQVVADWQHYAILQLVSVDDFQGEISWIADALGISDLEVLQARDRLVALGLLAIDEDGNWKDVSAALPSSPRQFSEVAVRVLQKQVLDLAFKTIDLVPSDKRVQGSLTLAIDAALIPSAREKIVAFQRALATSLLDGSNTKNAVYQMSISLYPLTVEKDS